MELLYFWISSFGCLEEFELCLTPNYSISFENNKLSLKRREYLELKLFASQIVNLTAIVGENGSGKSTILDLIIKGRSDIELYYNSKNESFILFLNDNFKNIEIENTTGISIKINGKLLESSNHVKYHKLLFLSTVYDGKSYDIQKANHPSDRLINLSTNYLIRAVSDIHRIDYLANEEVPAFFDNIERFELDELIREIKFLSLRKYKLPFEVPQEITIIFSNGITTNSAWFNTVKKIININIKFSAKVLLLSIMYHSYSKSNNNSKIDYSNICDDITKIIEEELYNDNDLSIGSNFLNNYYRLTQLLETEFGRNLKLFIDEISDKKYNTVLNDKITIRFNNNFELIAFINLYFNTIEELGYFNFKWVGLSTGQKAFLNLLSRFTLYNVSFIRNRRYPRLNGKSILILIDEGESHFHPKWQKYYIKWLTDFLIQYFNDCKIQIIITSNSPLILSDLSSENVIYIKRDDEGKSKKTKLNKFPLTFGANIHTLFTDSFFINDGLVGEFAKEKILDAIKYLKNNSSNIGSESKVVSEEWTKEKIKSFIKIIGEPLIADRLQKLYDEKYKSKEDIETRIAQLQNELNIMNNEKN
ncbi:AAA family ATPase [Candidatus Nomurabacteria bacterium]|nr:AAA family ATPase [Candidatus Nomurabacteria bacterium]